MVRALIGTMVYIGEGRFPTTWAREILQKKERPSDSVVFPAERANFCCVDYPADSELRSRIQKTLQHRTVEADNEDESNT
jgi:tRNA pseudouridine38-40 synthase